MASTVTYVNGSLRRLGKRGTCTHPGGRPNPGPVDGTAVARPRPVDGRSRSSPRP